MAISALFIFLLAATATFPFLMSIFCLESRPAPEAFWSIEVSSSSSQLSKPRLLFPAEESSEEQLVMEPFFEKNKGKKINIYMQNIKFKA